MQTTTQQANTFFPYWDKLKDLSNKDKQTLITMLQESMVEPKDDFEEAWARAIDIEDFRKHCHQKVKELYGKK